jgi:hypothetical protein
LVPIATELVQEAFTEDHLEANPELLILPFTVSFSVGVVVPIPTLPPASFNNKSLPFTFHLYLLLV